MRTLLVVIALALAAAAHAQPASAPEAVVIEGFADPALDARYRDLIYTIRCMKCQNQSIAESPVDQAADIRALVRDRIAAGESDREIRAYLVSRYGDFISYLPPFRPSTWLLWAAPALMLLGGGIIFARILRNRLAQPLDEELE